MSVPSYACIHFLILFPQTLILGAADLDCTYNTRGILFCSWNADSQYDTSPCNITAKAMDNRRDISGSCTLSLNKNPRHCAVRLTYNGNYHNNPLTIGHCVNISVVCSGSQKIVTSKFIAPYEYVQLDPPESLHIKMTEDSTWNLTWLVISNQIFNTRTEVLYNPIKTWQETNNITLWEKEPFVLLRGLKPNTLYEARVRVKAQNDIKDEPGAKWSYWSQSVEWKTPPEGSELNMTQLIVALVVVALFIVMLIIFYQNRVKKIIWIGVPSPSSFFDPLMSEYKGNFQKWLSSPFPFSSFSPEPCPPDISPLAVNWNKEEHRPKSLFDHTHDTLSEMNIRYGSSVSNRGYFTPNCPTYGNVDHQSFHTVSPHESLPSPTEDVPLFHADYLCAPLSIAGLGFHNKSFELDCPQRNMPWPMFVEEVMDNAQYHDEYSPDSPVTEEVSEKEDNEDLVESPGASSTAALVFHDVQPASQISDNAAGYFSLNELNQKHVGHWN